MNGFEVDGRPTLGGPIAGPGTGSGGLIPNQALAAQAAWWIDPINGRDTANGQTLGTALKTRNEFARRMFGVSLTQSITVHITSSLNAGDDRVPLIFGNITNGWAVNYLGTPTILFTGTVTGYVARNGATSTTTKMTIAGIPVSWTASGLINKVIEKTDGSVRAVIVADLGAKQASLSPPLSSINVQDVVFAVNDVINVYSLPDFRSPLLIGGNNNYQYLGTQTRWVPGWGVNTLTSCSGGTFGNSQAGVNLINHANGIPVNSGTRTNLSGRCLVYGGWNDMIVIGGQTTFNAHATLTEIGLENGSIVTTAGQGTAPNVPADLEFNTSNAALPCISLSNASSGRISCNGFVYGVATGVNLVQYLSRDGFCAFTKQPNVTTAININFQLQNLTELSSRLASFELTDGLYNNRCIGPAGAIAELDRYQIGLTAKAVVNETYPMGSQTNASALAAGNAYFIGIPLRAGDVVNTIDLLVNTAGTSMTVSLVGIYDKTGARLAVSADQGASWQTTGLKSIAIGPLTIPTSDMYYVGIFGAGTTLPLIARGFSSTAALPQFHVGAGVAWGYVQIGVATLPSPATFADSGVTTTLPFYWFQVR